MVFYPCQMLSWRTDIFEENLALVLEGEDTFYAKR